MVYSFLLRSASLPNHNTGNSYQHSWQNRTDVEPGRRWRKVGTSKVLTVLTVLCLPAWYRAAVERALTHFATLPPLVGLLYLDSPVFQDPFNPVPKMLTDEASQSVGSDDLKDYSWWKAAPFWPSCHLHHHLHVRLQAWVQLHSWALAACWNEGNPPVWEAVQYPEEQEAAGSHQQQCVCNWASRAAGTCPAHMTLLRCSMRKAGCASSDHTEQLSHGGER